MFTESSFEINLAHRRFYRLKTNSTDLIVINQKNTQRMQTGRGHWAFDLLLLLPSVFFQLCFYVIGKRERERKEKKKRNIFMSYMNQGKGDVVVRA